MKKLLFYTFLFCTCVAAAQSRKLDSLNKIYNNKSEADSTRLKALQSIAWSYTSNNPDTAIFLAEGAEQKLIALMPQEAKKPWIAKANNTIGTALTNKGNFTKALTYFFNALKLYEELKNTKYVGTSYGYIGLVYFNQSNYPKALESYLKSLKIAEETGDKIGIENCYTNLGSVYLELADYSKALEYYLKSLKTYTENDNKLGMSGCYINIGIVYDEQGKKDLALEYYLKGQKILEEIGDKQGLAICNINMSVIYIDQANYPKALECLFKSLEVKREIGDEQGVGLCFNNMASVYFKLANYKLALQYCDSSMQKGREAGDINEERLAYETFADIYAKTGKYKEAYEAHVKFKQLTDSIFNEDNSKQLGDLKTQFEVEKKEAELKIKSDAEQEKLKAVASEEKKRQQVVIASVVGVLLVVIIFSLFLYKRFKITEKQKGIIEEQKILVDKAFEELHEKNKEVMDSIHYAKRIQTALITSEKYIENSLNKLMKKIIYIIIVSTLLHQLCCAQKLDSLWKVYNDKSQADTNRLNAMQSITRSYTNNNPDTAIILAEQQIAFANSLSNKKVEKWIATSLNIIGLSFMNKGNYPKALDYYLKSLKIHEETGNKKGAAGCYNNIGLIYENQTNYTKALEYYLKALKLYEGITNYKNGLGSSYGNIGLIYWHQGNLSKSLEYHFKSLKIYQEIGNKKGITSCYRNIGNAYADQFNYQKALEYYLEDLKICKETDDKLEVGACYGNIGELYNNLANYKKAIQYCDSALQKTKETGDIDVERSAYQNMAIAYNKLGKYKEAYEAHVKFKVLTDSIFNADNSKQLGDLKTQFEVEKKEAELKIKSDAEQEKLLAVASEEKKRQQVIIASVIGVLLVVVIFSMFLYKRFKLTQKQKTIIEEQKILVDKAYEELHEKNKEVMDSIRYAKRIQNALITSEKHIENSLNKLMKR